MMENIEGALVLEVQLLGTGETDICRFEFVNMTTKKAPEELLPIYSD